MNYNCIISVEKCIGSVSEVYYLNFSGILWVGYHWTPQPDGYHVNYKCIISVLEVHQKCTIWIFQESCEWDIIEHIAERKLLPENDPNPMVVLSFELHLQRKLTFSSYILTLPCIFLASLTLVVFWLPADRPDRTGLGMIWAHVPILLLVKHWLFRFFFLIMTLSCAPVLLLLWHQSLELVTFSCYLLRKLNFSSYILTLLRFNQPS